MEVRKRLIIVLFLLLMIFVVGVVGYEIIEKWSLLDAIYMVVITLASVGYSETHPLSNTGRVFTVFLILGGMGVLFYGLSTITMFIVEGDLQDILRRRKMKKQIQDINDHYIICGTGETGKNIVGELAKTKRDFVVIEQNIENIKQLDEQPNIVYIEGDATEDAVLLQAGIEKAKGLVTALPSDRDNLFVVLTARELNPNLRIVSRCIEEESETKLRKAGANSVVSPNIIGGLRMASELVRPATVSFLDIMLRGEEKALRVEEARVGPNSHFIGKSIGEAKIPQKTGLLIVALNKEGQDYQFNPSSSTKLGANDVLIVIGSPEQVKSLKEMVQ
ncbi:MAG: NAD-binding protein [Deltaproteobacteria bacterium]|nr:MAG: NAD-binding protein [Deltaproteobacteria bacterium]